MRAESQTAIDMLLEPYYDYLGKDGSGSSEAGTSWYQEFHKAYGRKPSDMEIMNQGYHLAMNGEPIAEMMPEELAEMQEQLEALRGELSSLDKIQDQMKNLTAAEITMTREMTSEGIQVYNKMIQALTAAARNAKAKEARSSIRMGAILFARHADRYAEVMRSRKGNPTPNYTAMDYYNEKFYGIVGGVPLGSLAVKSGVLDQAMKRSDAKSIVEFHQIVKESGNIAASKEKTFFRFGGIDIGFDEVKHIISRHPDVSGKDLQSIIEHLGNIKNVEGAYLDEKKKGSNSGRAVLFKIKTPAGNAGVVLEFLSNGRVLLKTAFYDSDVNIGNWTQKKSLVTLETSSKDEARTINQHFHTDSSISIIKRELGIVNEDGQPKTIYNQAITADINLDDVVPVVDLSAVVEQGMIVSNKDLEVTLQGFLGEGISVPKAEIEKIIALPTTSGGIRHIARSGPMGRPEKRAVAQGSLNNIVDVLDKSVFVEKTENQARTGKKQDVENYYRFFVPIKVNSQNYTLSITTMESQDQLIVDSGETTLYELNPIKKSPTLHSGDHDLTEQGISENSQSQHTDSLGLDPSSQENSSTPNISLHRRNVNGWNSQGWKRTQEGRQIQAPQAEAKPDTMTIRDMLAGLQDKSGQPYINEDGSGNFGVYYQNVKGAMAVLEDGRSVIGLFEGADASTFVHEMAHVMFRDLEKLSQIEGVQEWILKDWQDLNHYYRWDPKKAAEYQKMGSGFGDLHGEIIKAVEAGNMVEAESLQERFFQERFARGFEAYLMSGEAPIRGLKKVFRQFKKWLGNIYNDFLQLGGRATPEIEAIMGRMIASEQEIAAEMEVANVEAFQNETGLTDVTKESAAAYARMKEEWVEETEEKLLAYIMKDIAKQDKESIRKMVEKERKEYSEKLMELKIWQDKDLYDRSGKQDAMLEQLGYATKMVEV